MGYPCDTFGKVSERWQAIGHWREVMRSEKHGIEEAVEVMPSKRQRTPDDVERALDATEADWHARLDRRKSTPAGRAKMAARVALVEKAYAKLRKQGVLPPELGTRPD